MTSAAHTLTHTASPVLFDFISISNAVVTHVLTTTIFANLQIGVAVDLRDTRARDAALAVQAIDVLADDMLEMVLLH